jgi:hypothetical protein
MHIFCKGVASAILGCRVFNCQKNYLIRVYSSRSQAIWHGSSVKLGFLTIFDVRREDHKWR